MRQGLTERLLLNSSKIKKEIYPVEQKLRKGINKRNI
jgi:hypothetical protein